MDEIAPVRTSAEQVSKSKVLDRRERLKLLAALRRTWRQKIVDSVDQVAVLEKLDDESRMSARFVFMTLMSAAIAVLGLLLSSPAVVIGAMLLSPLMGPILGAGFSLVVGDALELRACARTLFYGTILAIAITALIVFLSPVQTVTQEIASRTRPNLFDLFVALFSALAGAYAMIRGRDGTIVGVAIATALMPPLAVVGFGLATLNWTVFGGALLLFITNLTTIALSAAVMARFYGFSTAMTKKQTRLQVLAIVGVFAVLAIPLSIALRQIAWETNATRQAQAVIKTAFPATARVTQIDLDNTHGNPVVTATILTPKFVDMADAKVAAALATALGRPFDVKIDQFRVGTDPGAAEAAELAAARAQEQAEASERQISSLTQSLALVSGTKAEDIIVDRIHRRVIVNAHPIPGASLATYRTLESRVAADYPDWRLSMRPPALPLPDVAFDENGADAKAIALIAWAGPRVGAPIELTGDAERTTLVREALSAQGYRDVIITRGRGASVRTRWAAPDSVGAE